MAREPVATTWVRTCSAFDVDDHNTELPALQVSKVRRRSARIQAPLLERREGASNRTVYTRRIFSSLRKALFGDELLIARIVTTQTNSLGVSTASEWWRRAEEMQTCPKHAGTTRTCSKDCISCRFRQGNTTLMFWWDGQMFWASPTFRKISRTRGSDDNSVRCVLPPREVVSKNHAAGCEGSSSICTYLATTLTALLWRRGTPKP